MMTADPNPDILIACSAKDGDWLAALQAGLGPTTTWDDVRLRRSERWLEEFTRATEAARLIVCVLSPDYLASELVRTEEIPYLIERRARAGVPIVGVLVRACEWRNVGWLRGAVLIQQDGRPLDQAHVSPEAAMQAAARTIHAVLVGEERRTVSSPQKIDLSHLPATSAGLVGRQAELLWLDRAWASNRQRIACVVGVGGLGKSALVNHWLDYLAQDGYAGAQRVFGWSFADESSAGTASADLFLAEALAWFGSSDPLPDSGWARGDLLAHLIGSAPTLLVLDSLEVLQSPMDGSLRDPGLSALLSGVVNQEHAFCVITTQQPVPELEGAHGVTRLDLKGLPPRGGLALLRLSGVQASAEELAPLVEAAGNHPLVLSLVAAALRDDPEAAVTSLRDMLASPGSPDLAARARRVAAAFEERVGDTPEVEVLRMLAVLDRPATQRELTVLRASPMVRGLNERVQALPEDGWRAVIERLRRAQLVAPPHPDRPDELETHMLIRQQFADSMQTHLPAAWREAHNRLFEYLTATAEALPTTLEGLAPLYAAVGHGCRAGRVLEAFEQVYWRRIERGEEFFASHRLGALGANLSALSNFIDRSTGEPLPELSIEDRGWVANEVGVALQALGRLTEAVGPLEHALSIREGAGAWSAAAWSAQNLYDLHLVLGNFTRALEYAERSADLARRSDDVPRRLWSLAAHGDARHSLGRLDQAEMLFRDVEQLQGGLPLVIGVPGYWYNDLLLDLHRLDEVERRLAQTTRTGVLLDDGLFELMRGRLVLARSAADQAVPVDAEAPLNEAVDLLRRAGRLDYLPRALLARAELRRRLRHLEDARADLDELVRLATHTTMRLYEIEGRLEYARLNLARVDAAAAQRELARARDLVEATGYLRREAALADIQGQLDALLASPRSAETHAAPSELDPLGFVFRLVLDRRAPPDLLLHLDPRRLPDGLGQPAEIRRLNTELTETYAGVEPNALWLAWVRASRERELAALRERLDHGPIRTDTR